DVRAPLRRPTVFGRLVGCPDAGCFAISPPSGATLAARAYKPGTVTLETRWACPGATLTLTHDEAATAVFGEVIAAFPTEGSATWPRIGSREAFPVAWRYGWGDDAAGLSRRGRRAGIAGAGARRTT